MRVELLPGTHNVFRFPVERRARPTIELLREIAPDIRYVLNLAETFGFEPPPVGLRDHTDAETAGYIAAQLPPHGPERARALADLEGYAVKEAIDFARAAHDAWLAAEEARRVAETARRDQAPVWHDGLQQKADTLAERAVVMLIQAHDLAEEAEGVARAVDFARREEPWTPRNSDADTDALIALGAAAVA